MKNCEEIINFKCPRWHEIPEIDLYMDQVVNLLDKKLSPLAVDDEKIVTSTMINNYVKQKIITPPTKKKYDRSHIAQLIIIILFKKVFSVSEIAVFLKYLSKNENMEESYNSFCKTLENYITILFGNMTMVVEMETNDKIIETMIFAFVCKLYAQTLLKTPDLYGKDENDEQ